MSEALQPIAAITEQYQNLRSRVVGEGTGEEGFIGPLLYAKLGLSAGKVALVGVLGLGLGGASAWGAHLNYAGIEANADPGKAHTRSEATLARFDKTQKLDVATAYFQETLTASHIPYIINTRPIDLFRDYDVNKEVKGIGAQKFEVPFSAITPQADAASDKTDFLVDGKQVTATAYWVGAGPDVRSFTYNKDGKGRNYGDRAGFRNAFVNFQGGLLKLGNVDTLQNTLDDLDSKVDHDLKLKALESFSTSCPPKLDAKLKEAVAEAIEANVKMAGDGEKFGEVKFTEGGFVWKTEQAPPLEVKGEKYTNSYRLKDFKVDEMKCDVPPPPGAEK